MQLLWRVLQHNSGEDSLDLVTVPFAISQPMLRFLDQVMKERLHVEGWLRLQHIGTHVVQDQSLKCLTMQGHTVFLLNYNA